ncbi:MAG: phosphoglycerate kinase [Myxococcales bacterium FL481]|nr:MAG: phosphoglycerate kinase [Myxococcales bacterium FL481]
MPLRELSSLDLAGMRVLMRVDFNVPLDDEGRITSDVRIREALPTIRTVLERGGRPVLMSHLGRPKGKVVESLRLRPVGARLAELLGSPVHVADDCVGEPVEAQARELAQGECLLLENVRFHREETDGDPEFAARLARVGDVFVNDAFGTAHRAHASVSLVAERLPSAAGLLLARELKAFARVLEAPERPLVAILGGAKVSDKLPVLINLIERVDALVIGGAMAYTFLAADGVEIGDSRCEPELVSSARQIRERAQARGVELLLPTDHVCARAFGGSAEPPCGPGIPAGQMGLDIGPETIRRYTEVVAGAKTIVWNGPMGVFEQPAFRAGTEAVARAVADGPAFSVVGGGDSVAAVELLGVKDRVDHVSTGGGASLELLEGRVLPGVAAVSG